MEDVADRFDLTGRVALVTGGSRGLGRSMVLGFAHAGADVVIASRKLDACEALAEEVEATTGRQAMAYACHVGDWDQLGELVDAVYRRFDAVHVLVNNAGMSPLYDQVTDVTQSFFDKVIGVNLRAPFRLTSLIGMRMAEGAGGTVVNITSTASIRPQRNALPYAAAKAGLNALTVGFAHTLGPTVRVNGIMVGNVLTDMFRGEAIDALHAVAPSFALQRPGEPDEIVGAALFLASAASSYTTGTIVSVDGGVP